MQDELVTILGVKISPDFMAKVAKFKEGLKQCAEKMQQVATAGAVAGSAILALTKMAGDSAVKLESLSDKTGISSDRLQELEYVAKASGVSVDALNGDLEALTASLNNPTPGSFNEGLVLLGISSRDASGQVKKADDVLMEMADKIKGMSTVKAIEWGKKAGISSETIKLLKQGKANIQDLAKEGRALGAVVPKESVANLAKFSKAMSSLALIGKQLANTFFGALAPSLNKVVDLYKKFSLQNGGFVKSGIEKFAKQVGKAFEMVAGVFKKIVGGVNSVLQKFTPLTKLFKNTNLIASALTVAMGALAVGGILKVAMALKALALNPMTAIFLALIVVIEELYTYFTKGWEATGFFKLWQVFEKKFPNVASGLKKIFSSIKSVVVDLMDIFKQCWDMIKPWWEALAELGKAILSALKPVGEWIVDGLIKYFQVLFEVISKVVAFVKDSIGVLAKPIKMISGVVKGIAGWISGKGNAEVPQAVTQAVTTSPTVTVPASNTVNNNTVNNSTATGTTNVYIQAGDHNIGEVLGGVKREYGNSLNVTNAGQTGGGLIQ